LFIANQTKKFSVPTASFEEARAVVKEKLKLSSDFQLVYQDNEGFDIDVTDDEGRLIFAHCLPFCMLTTISL